MTSIAAIDSVLATAPELTTLGPAVVAPAQPVSGASFGDILAAGMQGVENKLATADDLIKRFTLDQNVPIHQVTYALEQARLSVELAMQVRGRLLDGYREIMNMQL
ncbi:flagellar hook-basal body complex protein FliE [Sphingomonas sp.]|jgi:flagellar hook-basal body complex protein FliE|uniref:flagellar hook-basal body complex protein FliE n=1 Tax=Sphingomonas sp. TaxID=28214 RepID=UPI002E367251|nr:flagellar hook-basal body complex protein FliE [Sphingomonas sp.]HEX4695800.1 flagellar hook-basal body complex protein FliE [Sphingomonas sp.]